MKYLTCPRIISDKAVYSEDIKKIIYSIYDYIFSDQLKRCLNFLFKLKFKANFPIQNILIIFNSPVFSCNNIKSINS